MVNGTASYIQETKLDPFNIRQSLNKKYLEISEKITYIKYNIKMYKCK